MQDNRVRWKVNIEVIAPFTSHKLSSFGFVHFEIEIVCKICCGYLYME